MIEQDLHPTASRFIASLVKSLQIVCNGQVDFNESIELIGHINVRVDRIHKYNYIVDEHVTKEGSNSSTSFLSNSYHSSPPQKSSLAASLHDNESHSHLQSDHDNERQENSLTSQTTHSFDDDHDKIRINPSQNRDKIVIKMEGSDNPCLVLPTSPEYDPVEDLNEREGQLPGTSATMSGSYGIDFDDDHSNQNPPLRKRKMNQTINYNEDVKVSKFDSGDESNQDSAVAASMFYGCSHCSAMFETQEGYNNHVHFCDQNSPIYQCSNCMWTVTTEKQMIPHLKTHEISNKYPCDVCNSNFKTYSGLRVHKQVKHKEGRTLTCPICAKVMYSKMNLEGHMNQHNGVKPHMCDFCQKSFSYKQSLKSHEKICSKRK